MNGSIQERIIARGIVKRGRAKENLKVYDVYYRFVDTASGRSKQTSKKEVRTICSKIILI